MRASAPLLTVVGTAVGAVAAVVAYQAGAGGATEAVPSSKDQAPETSAVAPTATKSTFLPCKKGTKLRKGVCVKVKKKVVVVFDPAPAPAAPAAPAVELVPATSAGNGDDSGENSGDDGTRARSGRGESASGDDREERGHPEDHESETEHSDDHDFEDSDEAESHDEEDGHEVESDD